MPVITEHELDKHHSKTNKEINFLKSHQKACPGEGFTPTAIVFVLEMVFPILFGNPILPEQKHRQKGDKPR